MPHGQSLRARLLVVEVRAGEVNRRVLDECQEAGRQGRLAAAMGAFLSWTAGRYEQLRQELGMHRRRPPDAPDAFGKAVLVVEEFGVIEIGALDMGGGSIRDGPDVGGEGFGIAPVEALVAFAQRLGDGAGQGLAGGLCNGLGEPVGFRIFDAEARCISFLLYHHSTMFA